MATQKQKNYYVIKLSKMKGTRKNANKIFTRLTQALIHKKPIYLYLKDETLALGKIYAISKQQNKEYDLIELVSWTKKIYMRFKHNQPDQPLETNVYDILLEPTISYD